MELRHLRYFVAVATRLSFTAASQSIHVAQAALSQTVKDLEEELGVKLLARSRQSVKLTAAGDSFLRDSERILRDVGDSSRSAKRVARGETGRLAIGFLGGTTSPFLPRLLREFGRLHPRVEISVLDGTPRNLTKALADGRIDVAITHPEEDQAHQIPVEQFQIFAAELCVVVPRGHPLARQRGPLPIKQLLGQPVVLVARAGAPWIYDTIVASFRRAGFLPRVVLTPNYSSTALVLVEAGLGIGLFLSSSVHSVIGRAVVFRPLTPKSLPFPTLLVWPRGLESPTTTAFISLVRSRAKDIGQAMRFGAPRRPG